MQRVTKRVFLLGVLGSLGLAAVLGVGMVFFSRRTGGRLVDQAIWAALDLAFMSLLCFLASIPVDKRRGVVWGWAGMVCGGLGAGFCGLVIVWAREMVAYLTPFFGRQPWRAGMALEKMVYTAWMPALYLVAGALLLMPRMRGAGAVVRSLTMVFLTAVVLMSLGLMWFEPGDDVLGRAYQAMLIITVTGGVATVILGSFGKKEPTEAVREPIKVVCPRCMLEQEVTSVEARCGQCKLKIKIEVEGVAAG